MIRRLDLVRHGHALPTSPQGDAGRELSPEGVAAVRALAESLRVTGWRPDIVLTSPLTRARRTSELLVAEQSGSIPVEILDDLTEGDPASVLAAIAAAARGCAHVVAVGHQPLLGLLIQELTGQSVPVGPGSFHAIELDRDSGVRGRIVARTQAPS
jgi:phosphohistidine phosphatase